MAPTIVQMRSFIAIAKAGSFTRAARAIHLSQPALTVQIRQLEDALQVRLLDRNTRTVQLTRIGRELVPVFDRVVNELDAVVGSARALASRRYGIVRVACLPSLAATILPAAIREFKKDHAGVEFVVRDGVGDKVLSLIKAESVDFGIAAGDIDDPDLETATLMRDRMHAVYLAPHALDRESAITAAKLSRYPLIFMDEDSTVRQLVDRAFRAQGVAVKPAVEATYMATAVGMVRAGLGVALLPSSAVEAKPAARVKSRPISGRDFVRTISFAWKRGRTLPPASAGFLTLLKRAR